MSAALSMWKRLGGSALGRRLYGFLICFKAPYFATIAPRFLVLEPGRCDIGIRDRRRVHNHIGTVHAIALCNMAELSAGMMTDVSIPANMRWIPKGMTVEYLAKAVGELRATATPATPAVEADAGYEWKALVSVRDAVGTEVFRASVIMWVSPRAQR